MTNRSVVHSSFAVEREYGADPARVFAAWADPETKARWFGGATAEHHELDFRIGGREITTGRNADGKLLRFESRYHDIVADERIVYSSTLSVEDTTVTVSVTTVRFEPGATGTTLSLTEQDTFLDGHEEPAWREQGTNSQLTALAAELTVTSTT